jgi:hypothetical protein
MLSKLRPESEKLLGCEEDLGGEATALVLATAKSLFGSFEKSLNGPTSDVLLDDLSGREWRIG